MITKTQANSHHNLNNNKGETLVETLLALLIITLVITSFAEVIANIAKANDKIKQNRTNLNYKGTIPASTKTWIVSVSGDEIASRTVNGVVGYENNGLFYYEFKK